MQSQLLREVGTYHFKMIPSLKSLQVNPCNLSRREHGSWDLPLHTGPKFKSQVTSGQSLQSQPSRAWKSGLTTSQRSQLSSHLRSIRAIPTVESMEVGTLALHTGPKTQVSSHLRSICAIPTVESMKVRTYHFTQVPNPKSQDSSFTWDKPMQSQPLRAWKLAP